MELLSDVATMAMILMALMMATMMMMLTNMFSLTRMDMMPVLIIITLLIITFFVMRKEMPQVCVLQFNLSLVLVD